MGGVVVTKEGIAECGIMCRYGCRHSFFLKA